MTNLKFGARVDNNGDINASSKKDLMKLQASVLTGTASKEEKVELKAAFDAAIKAGAKSDESVKVPITSAPVSVILNLSCCPTKKICPPVPQCTILLFSSK